MAYRRILLKLSGEVMAGSAGFGLDPERVHALASDIAEVAGTGVEIGLVVGAASIPLTRRPHALRAKASSAAIFIKGRSSAF